MISRRDLKLLGCFCSVLIGFEEKVIEDRKFEMWVTGVETRNTVTGLIYCSTAISTTPSPSLLSFTIFKEFPHMSPESLSSEKPNHIEKKIL